MPTPDMPSPSTLSRQFVEDWLIALRGCCMPEQVARFMHGTGLSADADQGRARVTLDQIVRLYQLAAVESEDEMMGLWSRPIRPRALQHLLTSVRAAETLPTALFRFSTFWNLLLDDYRFDLRATPESLALALVPRGAHPVQRFGHTLMLKLAHGLLSWLAGHEVPVQAVSFAFPSPSFAADYSAMFPSAIGFDAPCSAIAFAPADLGLPLIRDKAEVSAFLRRAPRDWIFTSSREHTWSLRVREYLFRSGWKACRIVDAAAALGTTPRTLMRQLDAEQTNFQAIKDALRLDIATRDLRDTRLSIEDISHNLGFTSPANFHRAFRRWTGVTPGALRSA